MTEQDIKTAFGETPDSFRHQVDMTLMQLEEVPMKKRYKVTTMLAATALCAIVLAGAALAAAQFGLLEQFNLYANPIQPLSGAEELIATNLGSTENDYLRVDVEEAVYDGCCAMLQLRVTPKDTENYALLHDSLSETPDDEYIVKRTTADDGSFIEEITGRRDGRKILHVSCYPELTNMQYVSGAYNSVDNEDGSLTIWAKLDLENPTADALEFCLKTVVRVDEEVVAIDPIEFTVSKNDTARSFTVVPVEGSSIDGITLRSGEITFTQLFGYATLTYATEPIGEDSMGYTFDILDADDNVLPCGGGYCDVAVVEDGLEVYTEHLRFQSLEDVPDTLTLQLREIGESDEPITLKVSLIPSE